ncbi:hypothetical protein HAX54_012275 [Datura stramonium]|uniref:Uncharacterized protein n=1 Tax=Datura stramonium TaxID=4076 RepID=A0ABS8RY11_DATST|nr:hypothetical protein [Datura stramonium]
MLEVVLEQVVSTDSRIQDLKNDLLNLTKTVKNHEVSIRQLEERMNVLAAQMESNARMITHERTKEKTTLTPSHADEEDIEREVEESFFKETWDEILLNIDGRGSEEPEKACLTIKCLGSYSFQPRNLDLDLKNRTTPPSQSSILVPPILELKTLPVYLRQRGKGKAPTTNATAQGVESDEGSWIDQLRFGLNKMKNYYVQFKEK